MNQPAIVDRPDREDRAARARIDAAGKLLRSGKSDVLLSWESTRIERGVDGVLTFWGSPEGAKPVPFRMASSTTTEIVFANPAHDYPQRIRYWMDGKQLNAETSLIDGSKAMRWNYSPMGN